MLTHIHITYQIELQLIQLSSFIHSYKVDSFLIEYAKHLEHTL